MTRTSSPSAKPRRRPGRPGGDEQALRAHLLDTALLRFARTGIAGTSLRAIAIEAGVTPAMLHYYFGDKVRLQQAVVEERLLPVLAPLREQLEQAGDDPVELIGLFVRGIGSVVARHAWLPPLWVREVLCEGGALREVLFNQLVPAVPQLLATRFAQAQADGRLNPALDPRLLVVSLVGLTLFPAAGAPIWQPALDAGGIGPDTMLNHTLALLQQGIGVNPSGTCS